VFVVLALFFGFDGFVFPEARFIPLYIGSEKFNVEVADTVEKQIRGLMFRESIPPDFGMLFVHEYEDTRSIWMKNTLVHLDIIYLDKHKRVVDMYVNVPPCKGDPCTSYLSRKPAQYVLELKGNRARELDLKHGDTIFFILDEYR
jgi:uncharacterized membrane protein (UPF0127 family)